MDNWLRRVYRGDPGIPHIHSDCYLDAWMGSFAVAAVSLCTSSASDLRKHMNLDDKAIRLDHHFWRKVMEKKHQNDNSQNNNQKLGTSCRY
ncbi:hypothetical protein ZIOFF_063553 [Zingiber officinale]|uniref:Uncharacterized protein n=1 Tax=Zingiber officinale TaxID=94328 RepID=A0A8J5F558_ZINOF|nr:hypothetical protein ZIOFF_063553 [Zingiber officinale]